MVISKFVNHFLFISNVFQKHIRRPPWEDWKGGLGGLPKTLWRTARGFISTNLSVNYLSRHSQNGEDDRHLRWEECATG